MSHLLKLAGVLLIILGLSACGSGREREAHPLEGSWRMTSGLYTSNDTTLDLTVDQVKMLNATHFAFGRQNEEGAYAGGGPYMIEGDSTYIEVIEYHSNSELLGDTIRFTFHVEGDSLFYQTGYIGEDFYLEEIYRRLD